MRKIAVALSGLLLALAVSVAAIHLEGISRNASASGGCSGLALAGIYGFADQGHIVTGAGRTIDVATEGLVFFKPASFSPPSMNGTLTGKETRSTNGLITRNVPITGVWKVNPDCTGSLVIASSLVVPRHYDFMAVHLGASGAQEVLLIGVDSGSVTTLRLERWL